MTLQHLVETLANVGQAWPDAPTVHKTLGRPWTTVERRAWLQLLQRTYGALTLSTAWAVFGRDARLTDLSAIEPKAPDWSARVRECSPLAPLLAGHLRAAADVPLDIRPLRQALLRRGLSPAGWKWLCMQDRKTVRKLCLLGWTTEAVFWTGLLSRAYAGRKLSSAWLEAGRPYMLGTHYAAAACDVGDAFVDTSLQLERFLRLMPSELDARTLREYEVIATGLHAARFDQRWALRLEKATTWETLLSRLRRYGDERLKLADKVEVQPGEVIEWQPRFGTLTLHGVQVRELTSTTELLKEGVIQTHCVGGGLYTRGCVEGAHVIASLEEPTTGMRATLQLVHSRQPGQSAWLIGQLAGISNTRVPQFFWQAGRELQSRLTA